MSQPTSWNLKRLVITTSLMGLLAAVAGFVLGHVGADGGFYDFLGVIFAAVAMFRAARPDLGFEPPSLTMLRAKPASRSQTSTTVDQHRAASGSSREHTDVLLGTALERARFSPVRAELATGILAHYVDHGELQRLLVPDWQLVLGSRGSGKTSLLMAHAEQLLSNADSDVLPIRLSASSLGSFGPGQTSGVRGTEAIRALFTEELYHGIARALYERTEGIERGHRWPGRRATPAILTAQQPFLLPSAKSDVRGAVEMLLRGMRLSRLELLIDDWDVLALDEQPAFANFLLQCLGGTTAISVKIATRSDSTLVRRGATGFRVGRDIAVALDLDSRSQSEAEREEFFGEVLLRRLAFTDPEFADLLTRTADHRALARRVFEDEAFRVLTQRAGTSPRDFLVAAFQLAAVGDWQLAGPLSVADVRALELVTPAIQRRVPYLAVELHNQGKLRQALGDWLRRQVLFELSPRALRPEVRHQFTILRFDEQVWTELTSRGELYLEEPSEADAPRTPADLSAAMIMRFLVRMS